MISVSAHFVMTLLHVKYVFCLSTNCYGPVSSSPKTASLLFGVARTPRAVGAALGIQAREECSQGSCSPGSSTMAVLYKDTMEEQRAINRACSHPAAFHKLPPKISAERDASPEGDWDAHWTLFISWRWSRGQQHCEPGCWSQWLR